MTPPRWTRRRPPMRLTLDPLTIERLDALAERWQTSRSGVVDRLAREAVSPIDDTPKSRRSTTR